MLQGFPAPAKAPEGHASVRLRSSDRESLAAHFIALDAEDRRLRFGSTIGDESLRQYAARIDFDSDGVFAIHDDDDTTLAAVIHVACGTGGAELGLSVLPAYRDKGFGGALFQRAVNYLRNRGEPEVFVHCLTENGAMMHLARKHGMRVVLAGPETDARLALDPPTAHTLVLEWLHDYRAALTRTARLNLRVARALFAQ